MSYPIAYGNNNQFSGLSFVNRKYYDTKVVPLEKEEVSIDALTPFIDMYVDKPFYGRIDYNSECVITAAKLEKNAFSSPDFIPLDEKKYLKSFKDNPSIQAMNFVVDAFEDMMNYFNISCKTRSDLLKDGPYAAIAPKVGWISPLFQYDVFIDKLYYFYRDKFFLANEEFKNSIINFKTFSRSFFDASIKNSEDFSLLYSLFNISKYCSPNSSGLIVEIAVEDHSDDYIKTTQYLNDKNFEFFKTCALRFGFFLDRNAPWRLIANLSSGNMLPYMQKYKLNNLKEVFDTQFIKSYNYDLMMLKYAIIKIYMKLVEDYPFYTKSIEGECGIELVSIQRENLTIKQLYRKVLEKDFIIDYVKLRMANMRVEVSEQKKDQILTTVKQMMKTRGASAVQKYISTMFKNHRKLLLAKGFYKYKPQSILE